MTKHASKILRVVCYSFGVTPRRVRRYRGPNDAAKWAKFAAARLCRELDHMYYRDIAEALHYTCPSSAMHACNVCRERMDVDRAFNAQMLFLETQLAELFKRNGT